MGAGCGWRLVPQREGHGAEGPQTWQSSGGSGWCLGMPPDRWALACGNPAWGAPGRSSPSHGPTRGCRTYG
eukprot:11561612-Alexandrium_andersonii.AAC.1